MDNMHNYVVSWYTRKYTGKGYRAIATTSKDGIVLSSKKILKHAHYFDGISFLFDHANLKKNSNVGLLINQKELDELNSFIDRHSLHKYSDFVTYLLANISQASSFARIYDNLDHLDGMDELKDLKSKVPKLMELIEEYSKSYAKMGEGEDSFNIHSISFKTARHGTISFKNYYIIHEIMSAIAKGIGGVDLEIIENATRQPLDKPVSPSLRYIDTKEFKSTFVNNLVLSLYNFFTGEAIHKKCIGNELPNSLAKLIVETLELGAFCFDDRELDHQNVRNWYKAALSSSHRVEK